ncbi:allergin-1 [Erythrolamprus reginae]|uniref:allergin-1 n=1 Tax=Erythrolamprus reginae TaxID=121349 RepID=UPI00396CE460
MYDVQDSESELNKGGGGAMTELMVAWREFDLLVATVKSLHRRLLLNRNTFIQQNFIDIASVLPKRGSSFFILVLKMTGRLGFLYLLLMWVQNSKENGGVKEDKKASPESPQNNASCSKTAKDIKIYSPTSEIIIGANVTLMCYWKTNCLPINYNLFLNKVRVQGPALQSMKEQKVVFNLTIQSNNQLGPYKCKADNLNISMASLYSPPFNFTLRENNNLAVFIVLPLILMLLLIVAAVTIRLLILPWCKARKLKASNICTAYDDADYEITQYSNLEMKTKTDYKYVNDREDSTVIYAEVICK